MLTNGLLLALVAETLDRVDAVRALDGGAVTYSVEFSLSSVLLDIGRESGDGWEIILGFGLGGTRALRRVEVVDTVVADRKELAVERTDDADGVIDLGRPLGGPEGDGELSFGIFRIWGSGRNLEAIGRGTDTEAAVEATDRASSCTFL